MSVVGWVLSTDMFILRYERSMIIYVSLMAVCDTQVSAIHFHKYIPTSTLSIYITLFTYSVILNSYTS